MKIEMIVLSMQSQLFDRLTRRANGDVVWSDSDQAWYQVLTELLAPSPFADLALVNEELNRSFTVNGAELAQYDHLTFMSPRIHPCIPVGTRIVCIGLKTHRSLNGSVGKVIDFKQRRYIIDLESSQRRVSVSSANVRKCTQHKEGAHLLVSDVHHELFGRSVTAIKDEGDRTLIADGQGRI